VAEPISVLSTEYRRWPVAVSAAGAAVDPTTDPVALAFKADGSAPSSGDFVAAAWETEDSTHYARVLIGPAGTGTVTLAPATYRVWLRITDNPEVPVIPVDTLAVVAGFAVAGGTYTNDPAANPVDRVRLLVGDTASPFSLSDAEVAWFLAEAAGVARAAAAAAGALAGRYARVVDVSVGDVRESLSQRAKQYGDLARDLAASAAAALAREAAPIPWAGGMSRAETEAMTADGDLVPPYFYEGMDARPGTTDRAGGWAR
jgi:hypothetical protein